MTDAPHHLIRASAGSGKTYRLSGRFLALLLHGVAPDRVLATTFTRKAAGEILDRVLTRLLAAYRSDDERARLAEEAGMPSLSKDRCVELLGNLVTQLDRFQVRTLDAFFVRVAQLFATDLELPPDWRIVDEVEDQALQAEALARALSERPVAETVEILRAIQRAGAPRSVRDAALRVVAKGRAAFLDSGSAAWVRELPEEGRLDRDAVRVLCEELAAIPLPQTQKGTPAKNWESGIANLCRALEHDAATQLLDLGLVKKVVAGAAEFDRRPIDEHVRGLVLRAARHAGFAAVEQVARQDQHGRAFLVAFDHAYRAVKRERSAYRFEDLPEALAGSDVPGVLEERLADLWFRLDSKIEHLLLDEFQDTAPTQWRALSPLAEEVLTDSQRSFFCVGDVKQSIYGWRGAEPRLLGNLPNRFPQLFVEEMTSSWRSTRAVLATVDQLFAGLRKCAAFDQPDAPGWAQAADEFLKQYQRHVAARADLPDGDAVVFEVPAEKGDDLDAAIVDFAVSRVRTIVETAPGATVGVLVRRRKRIAALIRGMREAGLHASGEGGNPLTDAESVRVVLSALLLADHPDHTMAAFHVATSRLAAWLGLDRDRDADKDQRHRVSAALRARLCRDGYGAFCTAVAAAVAADPEWSDWDRRRIRQLIDLALAFDARAGLRPHEFVEVVRQQAVEDPGGANIRVMTVHQAKGLEFDVVVLPELDVEMVGRGFGRALRAARDDPFGQLTKVSLGFDAKARAWSAELNALHVASEQRDVTEALCLLYVAMTRAIRRLEMLVLPEGVQTREATRFSAIVRGALGAAASGAGELIWRAPAGADDWAAGLERVDRLAPAPSEPELSLRVGKAARVATVRSPSGEIGEEDDVAGILAPPRRSAVLGTLVHRLFEGLEWLDDFAATDRELLTSLADLRATATDQRAALAAFRTALAHPQIAALLRRPGHLVTVHSERSFAVMLPDESGGEALWSGAFDRLVLTREGDQVVAADVIDFKTDTVEQDAELRARVERYRPQLQAYRRIAAAMFGLDADQVRGFLAFVTPGVVIAL